MIEYFTGSIFRYNDEIILDLDPFYSTILIAINSNKTQKHYHKLYEQVGDRYDGF
jgi:hypothetical protein